MKKLAEQTILETVDEIIQKTELLKRLMKDAGMKVDECLECGGTDGHHQNYCVKGE